jgi:hypothetical protein
MDDLDKFLEDSGIGNLPSTERSASMDNEDDFLAFLDTPGTLPSTSAVKSTGNFALTSPSVDDNQDFLDWLQDGPPSKVPAGVTAVPPTAEVSVSVDPSLSRNLSFIDTTTSTPLVEKKDVAKDMDNFFKEVFGSASPSISTKSRKGLFPDVASGDGSAPDSYAQRLVAVIESTFPDVDKLRALICATGYVPNGLRAQIWSLLLTETCTEDEEVRNYSAGDGSDGESVVNHQQLVADCNAVVSSSMSRLQLSNFDADELRKDLRDILVLYCQRRNCPYKSIFCQVLSPLLAVPERSSRVSASSTFYSIASEFLPLVTMNVSTCITYYL